MRRIMMVSAAMAALVVGIGSAGALSAEGGGTATLLFDDGDVALLADWSDLNVVGLVSGLHGVSVGSDQVAVDAAGARYALVRGYDDYNDLEWFDGIVRCASDGTEAQCAELCACITEQMAETWDDATFQARAEALVADPEDEQVGCGEEKELFASHHELWGSRGAEGRRQRPVRPASC